MERVEPIGTVLGDPVLAQCDVVALAYVFAKALEKKALQPPGPGPCECQPEQEYSSLLTQPNIADLDLFDPGPFFVNHD